MKSASTRFGHCNLVSSTWERSTNGELLVSGIPVSILAEKYGTPLFIYDSSILERKYRELRQILPERFAISYSVKANPHPTILSFYLRKGVGLEIASAGEFHAAEMAGCLPEDIVFAGPGKTEAELEFVIAKGIGEIHAESELEIQRIGAISRNLNVRTRVAVRVNPSEEAQGGAMHMGGKSASFGIDEEQLEQALSRVRSEKHLDFRGVHLFAGTQILDHKILLAQFSKGMDIARRAAAQMHAGIRTLDFGGGLGIPYFPGDPPLDLEAVGTGLRRLLSETANEHCFAQTRFMIEPGRFLVCEAGIYVARITDVKISRGKKYLILDGGMNHHLGASGNLGQVIKRNFPVAVLNRLKCSSAETVDVVGPLCTPLDTLARSVQLPQAEISDLIGIFQSGAYARTASPLGFLSHPTPPEVWVENGKATLIRRRGIPADYFADIPQSAFDELASASLHRS